MSDPAVQVIGLNRFVRQLKQLEPELLDELKGANKELAGRVESTARGLVPTRSGKLASSLRSSGTARSGIVRAGKARVPYAGPIHFGWASRNIRPDPFLWTALDRRRSEVESRYLAELERVSRKVSDRG
jgi:hypothetical protein